MKIQDEERRHIARDLHDSAGQTLSALKMSLAKLQAESHGPQKALLLKDLNALADEASQEIRTTSYLLHPPMLDECGFAAAAKWFVDGFSKRSGIHVHYHFPEQLQRLSPQVELVLFRVLQEGLTNIHRHSGATEVQVIFQEQVEGLIFEISDNGHGISAQQVDAVHESDGGTGVGIAGIRERVREIGGVMTIRSNRSGTTISLGLAKMNAFAAAGNDSVG